MSAEITPLLLSCRFPRLLVAGYRSLFEVTLTSISSEPVTDVVIEFRCEGLRGGIVEHRLARPLAPYERLEPIVIGILLESAGVMPMTVHVHASTARGRSTGRGSVRPLDQPGVTILERPADLQSFKLEIREKAFFGAIMEGMDLGKFTSINDLIGTPLDAPVEPVRLAWDGFPVAPTLKAGLMFGPFRLVRRTGSGGMGVVWEAQDTSLKNKVIALKFLPEQVCHDPAAIDDLRDEVLKARALRHDHIVSIHHIHEHDGTAAICMECIDGPTLDDYRRSLPHKVFEVADLQRLLPSLCEALDYAHKGTQDRESIIHHDLKPLNLMLTGSGGLKVCDFGLAGGLSEARTKLSMRKGGPSAASGTLYYMSPQHLLLGSRVVTDDVYSLGATLYELLTSKPPFYAGSIETQIEQIAPPRMAERRRILGITGAEPIPEAWERAVAACLAKNPNDRPQSAGALLALCMEGREASSPPSSTARRASVPQSSPELQLEKPSQAPRPSSLPEPAPTSQSSGHNEANGLKPTTTLPVASPSRPSPATSQSSPELQLEKRSQAPGPPSLPEPAPTSQSSGHNEANGLKPATTLPAAAPLGPTQPSPRLLPWALGGVCVIMVFACWRPVPKTIIKEVPVADTTARVEAEALREKNKELERQAKEAEDKRKLAEDKLRDSQKPPTTPPPAPPPKAVPVLKAEPVSPLDDGSINNLIQVKLPGDVIMKLCYCPAGSFKMGSPNSEDGHMETEEQVNVTLPKAFWLGQTEVTQAQWYALMKTTPAEQKAKGSSFGDVTGIGPNQPMYFVNWEDAQEFIARLNSSVKMPAGWVFALPTEAEWEYACRANPKVVAPYAGELGDMAWYSDNAGSTMHEVATKKPNAWSLYDMHGNLYEWCFDAWDGKSKLPGGTDPVGTSGSYRVVRGGCWVFTAGGCRSASRPGFDPGLRDGIRGFRVAAVPAGSGASQ